MLPPKMRADYLKYVKVHHWSSWVQLLGYLAEEKYQCDLEKYKPDPKGFQR